MARAHDGPRRGERFPRFRRKRPRYASRVLRKFLWTALYAVLGAAATLVARKTAARIWRVATGEEPPTRR